MLPVSQAVQASKPTQVHPSASAESNGDQGFAALFAQGLGTPDAGATGKAEGTPIQRSPGAATAPGAGEIRRSSGETTAAQGSDASVSAASDPKSKPAETPADAPASGGRPAHAQQDDTAADPANALLIGLQGAQQIALTPAGIADVARPVAGTAAVRSGANHLRAGDAGIALSRADDTTGGPVSANGLEFRQGLSAAAQARGEASGDAGAAPAGEAANALGAGLSALLARQGGDAPGSSAWTSAPNAHAGAGIGSAAGVDGGLLYSQVAQNLLQTPALDAATAAALNPALPLTPPLGDERWSAALGQQALFMARNQLSSAQLTVNPPNLGPIQITLDLKHDQATAVFVSPHDAVRQAIEASLPQLRDMFSAAGLNLSGAQVQSGGAGDPGQSSGGEAAFAAARERAAATAAASGAVAATGAPATRPLRVNQGLLDTFA